MTIPRAKGWYAGPHERSESSAGCNKYVGKADWDARCVSRVVLSSGTASRFSEMDGRGWRGLSVAVNESLIVENGFDDSTM